MKTKYIAVIIWAVFMSVLLFMLGCSKDEPIEPTRTSHEITQHKVRYFVNTDSAAVRIQFDSTTHSIFYVRGHYDTTYYSNGGHGFMLIVTCFDYPMNAGLIVDDSVIDNCFNVDYFEVHYKL